MTLQNIPQELNDLILQNSVLRIDPVCYYTYFIKFHEILTRYNLSDKDININLINQLTFKINTKYKTLFNNEQTKQCFHHSVSNKGMLEFNVSFKIKTKIISPYMEKDRFVL